ncbi:MAG: hypothetical protein ACRD1C_03415 [Terriglobales bacterium]
MTRALCLAVLLAVFGCARAPAPAATPPFVPPDGHWWLNANAEQRDGFLIGYAECDALMLGHAAASISAPNLEAAITRYYQARPDRKDEPVITAINALSAAWKRTGAYHFVHANPSYEYDGETWREGTDPDRDGMIRGFLACQEAELGARVRVPVEVLIQRVSAWYGIDPHDESIASGKTINDKLGAVILHAEREGP